MRVEAAPSLRAARQVAVTSWRNRVPNRDRAARQRTRCSAPNRSSTTRWALQNANGRAGSPDPTRARRCRPRTPLLAHPTRARSHRRRRTCSPSRRRSVVVRDIRARVVVSARRARRCRVRSPPAAPGRRRGRRRGEVIGHQRRASRQAAGALSGRPAGRGLVPCVADCSRRARGSAPCVSPPYAWHLRCTRPSS